MLLALNFFNSKTEHLCVIGHFIWCAANEIHVYSWEFQIRFNAFTLFNNDQWTTRSNGSFARYFVKHEHRKLSSERKRITWAASSHVMKKIVTFHYHRHWSIENEKLKQEQRHLNAKWVAHADDDFIASAIWTFQKPSDRLVRILCVHSQ